MKTQPNITIRSNKLIDGSDAQRGDLSHHGDVLVRGIYNGMSDVRRVKSLDDSLVAKMMDYATSRGGYVMAWAPGLTAKVLSSLPVGSDAMSEQEAAEEVARIDAIEEKVQYDAEKLLEAATTNHAARQRDVRGRFVAAA